MVRLWKSLLTRRFSCAVRALTLVWIENAMVEILSFPRPRHLAGFRSACPGGTVCCLQFHSSARDDKILGKLQARGTCKRATSEDIASAEGGTVAATFCSRT